ncbi:roadblock/LC7 domain-containing protein [Kitasatospora sp. NPDC091207]|uniref:roadblock/LC7 domain-containing protein n=1 Tax=Kitasatospora sp. NPDC091207 TaxID=3364083 RepID=UPI0038204CA5
MTRQPDARRDLHRLLDQWVARATETRPAAVLSADGLPVGLSRGLEPADAAHLSPVPSGLRSPARGTGDRFHGGRVRRTVVEMDQLFLFVTTAGQGARLTALTSDPVEAGPMAHEITMLVEQVGQYLSAAPRGTAGEADPGGGA